MTSSSGSPLPVRPRPRHGETADSYLRRLAAANHLRFTYLRRYVATPRGSYGLIDPDELAVLAGRSPDTILRAFPELAPTTPKPGTRRYTREEVERNQAARREKYAAIRRDADDGLSRRAIISSRHVGRRTVALALASAEPPERKKIHREPAALNGLHTHIDAMIDEDPAIGTAAIWQRLADDHGVTVAYYTLRTYVVSRQAAKAPDKTDRDKPALRATRRPCPCPGRGTTSSHSKMPAQVSAVSRTRFAETGQAVRPVASRSAGASRNRGQITAVRPRASPHLRGVVVIGHNYGVSPARAALWMRRATAAALASHPRTASKMTQRRAIARLGRRPEP